MDTETVTQTGLVGVKEAAEAANVTRTAIYQWIEKGWLQSVPTTSGQTKVRLADVIRVAADVGKGWRDKAGSKPAIERATRRQKIKRAMRKAPFMPLPALARLIGETFASTARDVQAMRKTGEVEGTSYVGWIVKAGKAKEGASAKTSER